MHTCISHSIFCSKGVGDLIPYEDKWWSNVRVGATYWKRLRHGDLSWQSCIISKLLTVKHVATCLHSWNIVETLRSLWTLPWSSDLLLLSLPGHSLLSAPSLGWKARTKAGNKMQPTNPNAHTYVNGTDAETHGYAVRQNTFLKLFIWTLLCIFPLLPYQQTVNCWNMEEGGVLRVECGVQSLECKLWSVKCGVSSVKCKVWSVDCRV